MNLKRIIREEIDDLDWIRDIQPNRKGILLLDSKSLNGVPLQRVINLLLNRGWTFMNKYGVDMDNVSYGLLLKLNNKKIIRKISKEEFNNDLTPWVGFVSFKDNLDMIEKLPRYTLDEILSI
jgi:hypothetical protein